MASNFVDLETLTNIVKVVKHVLQCTGLSPVVQNEVCKPDKGARKVDVRLPGKRDSNSHGARPVHLIITMIKWIRTSRLSIKNSLSASQTIGKSRTVKSH